jgi:hypothetical protein
MEEVGVMRTRAFGLIALLTAALALHPGTAARAQEVPPADPAWPFPLYHTRPETGGLFVDGSFVMYRQTNPLEHQPIAFRGFFDVDGSITGHPGGHVGNFAPALFADDAGGPGTYQAGFRTGIGWRFDDGISIELSWMHLMKSVYFATISGVSPLLFKSDPQLANTYISAPVYNFPIEYSGPLIDGPALATPNTPIIGTPGRNLNAGFGLWNAADEMSIEFDQRFEQVDIIGRVPIVETDCDRCYGLVGFRGVWLWERFKWRTVDQGFGSNVGLLPTVDIDPITGQLFFPPGRMAPPISPAIRSTLVPDQSPLNAAIYTNIVSNRLYGPAVGFGNEWYIGHGFSISTDVLGVLSLDVVKERAKYELGQKDQAPQAKRSVTTYTIAPEVQAGVTLWWYPIEGVQVQVGYDIMGFFNTIAAPNPVSFNYGGLDPAWTEKFRFFDGLRAGVGFIF